MYSAKVRTSTKTEPMNDNWLMISALIGFLLSQVTLAFDIFASSINIQVVGDTSLSIRFFNQTRHSPYVRPFRLSKLPVRQ